MAMKIKKEDIDRSMHIDTCCVHFFAKVTESGDIKFTGAGRTIIEGANVHIFVFTDCKNNRFQKKLIKQNAHI